MPRSSATGRLRPARRRATDASARGALSLSGPGPPSAERRVQPRRTPHLPRCPMTSGDRHSTRRRAVDADSDSPLHRQLAAFAAQDGRCQAPGRNFMHSGSPVAVPVDAALGVRKCERFLPQIHEARRAGVLEGLEPSGGAVIPGRSRLDQQEAARALLRVPRGELTDMPQGAVPLTVRDDRCGLRSEHPAALVRRQGRLKPGREQFGGSDSGPEGEGVAQQQDPPYAGTVQLVGSVLPIAMPP